MLLGRKTFELQSGSCFLLPRGCSPKASQDPEQRLVVFAVHFNRLAKMPMPGLHTKLHEVAFFAELARHCESAYRRKEAMGKMQSELYLRQMLLLLYEEQSRPAPSHADLKIRELIRDVQTDPGRRWTVGALARKASLSRSQFTRRFTAVAHISPTRFLVRTRIERAQRLIEETGMTLNEIAEALNYRDVYFFSRQFRQITGKTPGSHRGQ